MEEVRSPTTADAAKIHLAPDKVGGQTLVMELGQISSSSSSNTSSRSRSRSPISA
jgi:hypothetical protein